MIAIDIDVSDAMAVFEQWPQIQHDYVGAGAKGAYDFLRDYHSKMTWRGERWIPGRNSGQFAQKVVEGWQPPVMDGANATVRNTFGLLSWKITGGTIFPRNAKFLTIPLISEAKGVPARSIGGLFVAGHALCRKIGKQLEAVYALSKGVNQAPWPGAMPPNEEIAAAFGDGGNAVLEKWGQP